MAAADKRLTAAEGNRPVAAADRLAAGDKPAVVVSLQSLLISLLLCVILRILPAGIEPVAGHACGPFSCSIAVSCPTS